MLWHISGYVFSNISKHIQKHSVCTYILFSETIFIFVLQTLQAFLPKMIQNNHGHIVSLSSCTGLIGCRNLVPYCASKYAVRGMMDALVQELRVNPKNRVKVTVIYPYMVDTGLCIRPNIRFPSLMPMQKESDVAKRIISAQRRELYEASIPKYLLSLFSYLR